MRTIQITVAELPGAIFASREALLTNVTDRQVYDHAVAAFSVTRDADTLAERLEALGYDDEDIEWHIVRPGERLRELFV